MDWDALFDAKTWVAAYGQVFFSLSVGWGILLVLFPLVAVPPGYLLRMYAGWADLLVHDHQASFPIKGGWSGGIQTASSVKKDVNLSQSRAR